MRSYNYNQIVIKSIEQMFKKKALIDINPEQSKKLSHYIALIHKWSRVIQLISDKDRDHIIQRHIINSLIIFNQTKTDKYSQIADIGAGNGFPGIVLGIFYPEKLITLIENRSKKASFLNQALYELELKNMNVFSANAEKYDFTQTDLILSRAFGDIKKVLSVVKSEFNGDIGVYQRDSIMMYGGTGIQII